MRVLQVHNRYRERGGEDAVVDREAALLIEAGHEVTRHVVTNPVGHVRTAAALAASPWNARQAGKLATVIEETSPDVAHVHNTWFSLSPSIFHTLERARIPTVLSLHNYRLICPNGLLYRNGHICEDCVGGRSWKAVRHRCYRDSALQSAIAAGTIELNHRLSTWTDGVDVFIANTDLARSKFVEGGFPEDRFLIIPNSVPDPGPRVSSPSDSRTVLFVGRLSQQKGIDLLLSAWPTMSDLELLVVGDGPLRADLERRYPDVAFTRDVVQGGIADLMMSSRSLMFPSQSYEGMPNVVLEAMAAGLPVMAAYPGAAAEVIHPLGSKWTISGDWVAWATGLKILSVDEAVRTAGEIARAAFLDRYDARDAVSRLETAYERARDRRPRRT